MGKPPPYSLCYLPRYLSSSSNPISPTLSSTPLLDENPPHSWITPFHGLKDRCALFPTVRSSSPFVMVRSCRDCRYSRKVSEIRFRAQVQGNIFAMESGYWIQPGGEYSLSKCTRKARIKDGCPRFTHSCVTRGHKKRRITR